MATAVFYSTAKRHNSTLVPSSGTSVDVQLKDGCDLLQPVFLYYSTSVPAYSMLSFESRYYFITDIVSVRQDLWEIHAAVDVLATYKSEIQSTTAYILYDANSNTDLVDSRLPINTVPIISTDSVSFSPYYLATGTYLLTATNTDGCKTYAMSSSAFRTFLSGLYSWVTGTAITIQSSVEEAIANVGSYLVGSGSIMENIKGCTWVPFDYSSIAGSSETVKVGLYDQSSVTGQIVGSGLQTVSWTVTVSIPWYFSDWRRNSPYTQIYVYLPFIGTISIPPCNAINDSTLAVEYSINKTTGALAVEVFGYTSGQIFYVGSGQSGNAIPVGVSSVNAGRAAGGAVAAISSLIAGDLVGTARNAYNGIQSNPQNAGGISGGAGSGLNTNVIVKVVSHNTSVEPNTIASVIGTPVFAHHSLATKSGYVMTELASVSGSMTDTERTMINDFLNGGIFIE